MRKTLLIPFVLLIVTAFILASCQPPVSNPTADPTTAPTGGAADDPTQPAPQPEFTSTAVPTSVFSDASANLGGTKIHLWAAWGGETGAVLDELRKDFNGSNPWGIWLEVQEFPSYDALEAALDPLWGQPELPEVVVALPEQASRWDQDRKGLVDLTPYVDDPTWGISVEDQADFIPVFWMAGQSDSKRLGLPALGTAQVMFYNLTWGKELGFDAPPANTDEFVEQVCAAAQANRDDDDWDNDGTGGWLIDPGPLTAASWVGAFGGSALPDSSGAYRFDHVETEAAFEYLQSGFGESCFWIGRKNDPLGYFAVRNALVVTGSLDEGGGLAKTLARAGSQDEWTVLPFPQKSGDASMIVSSEGYHLLQSSPQEQLAGWLVMRWLSQADRQARLAPAGWHLPASTSAAELLNGDSNQPRAWKAAAALLENAQHVPFDGGWSFARQVLQDATQQLFTADTKPESIPGILEEMDRTIQELEGRAQ